MKELYSGNEAIARGAWEAHASVGAAYPGTPSTETLECFARYDDVYAEWCTNEKVALEVAIGSSAAGARSLVTMKHVGLNVAADPLFTASYTGVNAGLVLLVADDPGMYSSQNEQDTHYYSQGAQILTLDPSDSQEAHDMAKEAFELSERFDTPVILRSTVRISHTKTPIEVGEKIQYERKPYETDPSKWVMMPLNAKPRHVEQIRRTDHLKDWVNESELNKLELRDEKIGIVCYGAAYQHVREALPKASTLKLGVSWPLPTKLLKELEDNVDNVYVIEEASTYLSDSVKACGIKVSDTICEIPKHGELTPETIKVAFGEEPFECREYLGEIPKRPPALCAGCPHRLVFKELSRLKAIITGDIGCYTLGALPPLNAMDSVVDMGASVSMAHGFELAFDKENARPVVGVIGDSTFAHSGLSSLISAIYNSGAGTICILDNRTTAMTGRQGNPFNGETLQHRPSRELDLEGLIESLGADSVRTIDPNIAQDVRCALKEATSSKDTLDVLIFKSPCVLLDRKRNKPYMVTNCTGCGVCLSLGCPAIGKSADDGLSYIDAYQCIGCGQCAQYCRFNAIVRG